MRVLILMIMLVAFSHGAYSTGSHYSHGYSHRSPTSSHYTGRHTSTSYAGHGSRTGTSAKIHSSAYSNRYANNRFNRPAHSGIASTAKSKSTASPKTTNHTYIAHY